MSVYTMGQKIQNVRKFLIFKCDSHGFQFCKIMKFD